MSSRLKVACKLASASVRPPSSAPFGTLQRKCACGGSGSSGGGECESCRKKKQSLHQRALGPGAPAKKERQFGHDYSSLQRNAQFAPSTRLPELGCLSRLHMGAAGETGCNVSKGTPSYAVNETESLCNKPCTERHEQVHVADLSPCCGRAKTEYDAASTDDKKSAVQGKMNDWVKKNEDYFECRAYAETLRCADEFMAAHCNGSSPGAISDASSTTPGPGQAPMQGTDAAAPNQQPPATQMSERLSEGPAPDNPAPAPKFKPELCCETVKHYRFVHKNHHDAFCKSKKSLTACPF